ncbi:hypothetical protein [Polyangium spumosum]|uniref:hypothetical protein n=1 Tax=Polyangium spumosum TaxID=889282 RepID=UPI00129A276F|nr:hypothetical protein [Polyangium spumosum]
MSCFGKDLRDVLAEHRAPVEAKLAKVKALREQARALPAVSSDAVHIAGGPAPVLAWKAGAVGVNASIVHLEDLDDLTELGNIRHRASLSKTINRCASVFATHREPYNAAYPRLTPPPPMSSHGADEVLGLCQALRYLLVIRSLAFVEPSDPRASISCSVGDAGADGGNASASETCHRFDGGYLKADVLVFDVETQRHLGGFVFVAESSAMVDVTTSGVNVKGGLERNFDGNIDDALQAAARKVLPDLPTGN